MKDFRELAKEIRQKVQEAICVGPISDIDQRLSSALDEFEASIVAYADDEAIRRAKVYIDQMGGLLDGEPVFDKGASDEATED